MLRITPRRRICFDFSFLVEEVGKTQSRCFTSFSMTQQPTSTVPKGSGCAFARDIPTFGCGFAALRLCGESVGFGACAYNANSECGSPLR
jgi:hypothetical protein